MGALEVLSPKVWTVASSQGIRHHLQKTVRGAALNPEETKNEGDCTLYRLKPYRARPVQLQPQPTDVEVVARMPADLNVGEQAVKESPETCPADLLPEDSTP